MATIDDRLAELSITLPTPPAPLGNYVGAVTVGNLVFMSGHGTNKPDGSFVVGRVPVDSVSYTHLTLPTIYSV